MRQKNELRQKIASDDQETEKNWKGKKSVEINKRTDALKNNTEKNIINT